MADEWKYKDLPRAANGIAPAKWNPDTGEFEVYTGVNDVKAIGVEDRLTAIENKLDSVIQNGSVNTQVTGSNVALDLSPRLEPIKTPIGFSWQHHPLQGRLFRDAQTGVITTDFDVSEMKYKGNGKTYYVSKTGNDSNDGLSWGSSYSTVNQALAQSDAETVMIGEGTYPFREAFKITQYRNLHVNLIGQGEVNLTTHDGKLTWSLSAGYTNTYESSIAYIGSVLDTTIKDEYGDYKALTNVGTIAEVEQTPNSWFHDGSKVYLHTSNSTKPDESIWVLMGSKNFSSYGNQYVYVENVNFYGGIYCVQIFMENIGDSAKFFAKNCKFKYSNSSGNNLEMQGTDITIFQNCESSVSTNDGFNYHFLGNTIRQKAIEINCKGRSNGLEGDNDNGSSIHDGGVIIRVNGKYYNNVGPNVADVNDGTESWNLGCVAYGSKATTGGSDFTVSSGKAEMWLDSCAGYGSVNSLSVDDENSKAYVKNSKLSYENVLGKKYNY